MFDLDGTLADTLTDIAAAGNYALAQMDQPIQPVEKYRFLAGQGAEAMMSSALDADNQHLVARGCELVKAYYLNQDSQDVARPFEGSIELLDTLKAKKLTLAVLSNRRHVSTVRVVEKLFGTERFDAVKGYEPPVGLKPDPTSALKLACALGIDPINWLYVGDTQADMQTAVGAGMFPVGVLWGFREEAELLESGAKAIIKHPSELLALL